MFGAAIQPSPPVLKPRPVPKIIDVPGHLANAYGHMAREPNTCYNYKMMQYNQKKNVQYAEKSDLIFQQLKREELAVKYIKHFENKSFTRTLEKRLNTKLEEYEVKIEERRKKLTELLWKEERDLIREVVDDAQKGKERKTQERIEKYKKCQMEKEEQRLEFVKEMRLKQYIDRCAEFRPAIISQRLQETKQVQLLQMEENKSRKESEKELDHLWKQLTMKQVEAFNERERQNALQKLKQQNEFKFYSDLQAKERDIQNEARKREIQEDKRKLDELKAQIEKEEREFLENKRSKRNELAVMFNTQVKERQAMLKRIADQETQIQEAYKKLADEELEKEKAKEKAKVSTAYQDMIQYKQYLADLQAQKEEDARNMGEIIKRTMDEIRRKQDEESCKAEIARKALQENVMKERAQQLEYRRKQEEEEQKIRDLEKELNRASLEQNSKLREEKERQDFMQEQKYREQLKKQIEYSKILKERERENTKKMLESAKVENEIYDDIVRQVLSGNIKISEDHPFRQVIKNEKCPCPKPNY